MIDDNNEGNNTYDLKVNSHVYNNDYKNLYAFLPITVNVILKNNHRVHINYKPHN